MEAKTDNWRERERERERERDSILTLVLICEFFQQYALIFPLATVVLKLPLVLPCVDTPLQKIRRGYDREKRPSAVHPLTHVTSYDMARRGRDGKEQDN